MQTVGVMQLLGPSTPDMHTGVCPAAHPRSQAAQYIVAIKWQPPPAPELDELLDVLPAMHTHAAGHVEHWPTGVAPEHAIEQPPQLLVCTPHPPTAANIERCVVVPETVPAAALSS
jgi:hypothetical protein